jgi:hypothetical protein
MLVPCLYYLGGAGVLYNCTVMTRSEPEQGVTMTSMTVSYLGIHSRWRPLDTNSSRRSDQWDYS